MLGILLTAGGGTRLQPLTADRPKTLLPIDDGRCIFDVAVANLAAVGVSDILVVTGHRAEVLEARYPQLATRHDVTFQSRYNERFADWNNAYSLWLARDAFAAGALVVNGDTLHPAEVERRLLAARGSAPVLVALDDQKVLGDEEMKILLDGDGRLTRINKAIAPATADGEYIGVTLVEPEAAEPLADALQATFERDPGLYYEDGYQELADRGGVIRTASVGGLDWVEVDDHQDLARAREIACRY